MIKNIIKNLFKMGVLFLVVFPNISSASVIEPGEYSEKSLANILNVKSVHIGKLDLSISAVYISKSSRELMQDLGLQDKSYILLKNGEHSTGCELVFKYNIGSNERNGYYKIFMGLDSISIEFRDRLGLIYALNTLQLTLEYFSGNVPIDTIFDYPDIAKRYVHLILPIENNSRIYDLIDLAILNKFNGVVLQIKDRVSFNPLEEANWNQLDLKRIVEYCQNSGLVTILEIKFLTHQDKSIFKDVDRINRFTYNPASGDVKSRINQILMMISNDIKPDGVHIGFDELHGYRNDSQRQMVTHKLDYREYFDHLEYLDQLLSELNLVCLMWSDMLLNPREFSEFTANGWINKPDVLLDVPKSIILCDWQYWNFRNMETYKFLSSNGNGVIPATWCSSRIVEEFSNYMKQEISYNESAIMCTTWPGALITKLDMLIDKGCDLLSEKEIIEFSGRVFW